MIIWEGTHSINNYADYKGDIQYSQKGPLGLEVLKVEETETQVIFRVGLYSNNSTITELRWGFNWDIVISDENYFTPTLGNAMFYEGIDNPTHFKYYNQIDKIEFKNTDKNIWLLDTTLIAVDKPKDRKLRILKIQSPTYRIKWTNLENSWTTSKIEWRENVIFSNYAPCAFQASSNTIIVYYNKGVIRDENDYFSYPNGMQAYRSSYNKNKDAVLDPELTGIYYKQNDQEVILYPEWDDYNDLVHEVGVQYSDGSWGTSWTGATPAYITAYYNGTMYGYNSKRDGTGEEFAPEFKYSRNEDIELYPDIRPLPNWASKQKDEDYKSLVYYLDLNYEPEKLDIGSKIVNVGILKNKNTAELRYFLTHATINTNTGSGQIINSYGPYGDAYGMSVLWNVDKMFGLHPENKHFKEWNTKPDGTGITITSENIADFYTAWNKHYVYTRTTTGNSYLTYSKSMTLGNLYEEVKKDEEAYSGDYVQISDGQHTWLEAITLNNVDNLRSLYDGRVSVEIYRRHYPEATSEYIYDGVNEDVTYLSQGGEQELINLSEIGEFMRSLWTGTDSWTNTYTYYEPKIDLRGLVPSHIYWDRTYLPSNQYPNYYTGQEVACRLYAIWGPDESTVTLDNHLVLEGKDYTVTEKADYNGKTVTTLEDAYNYYTTVASGRYALNKDFGYEITDTRYTGIVEFIPFSKWEDKDFDPFDGAAADYEITLYRQYIKQIKPAVTFGEAASFTKAYDELLNISLNDEELISIVGPGATVKYWQDQYGNKYGVGTPNNFYIPTEENRHLTLTPMVVGKDYSVTLKSSLGETKANCFYGTFTFGIQNLDPYKDEINKKAAEKLVNSYNNILNKKIKGWKVNDNDLVYDLTLALASNTDYTNPIDLNLVLAEKTKNIVEFYDGDEHKFDLAIYSDDTYDEWCIGNLFNVKRFYKNGYVFDGVTLDGVKFIDKNFKIIADTVLFDINGKSHVDEDDTIETYRVQIQWKWAPGVVIEKQNYTCHICIDGEFKEVLPYIYHNGRWQIATYDWRGV